MRSGAVTNRTYRAWGKIKLPKYLFKLHTGQSGFRRELTFLRMIKAFACDNLQIWRQMIRDLFLSILRGSLLVHRFGF